MKVAMLAAGVGRRLGLGDDAPPKALLRFGGQTLLGRHLEILAHFGLFDLTLVVGHQAHAIERDLRVTGAQDRIRTCFNPDYRGSSLLSLWMLRDALRAGEPVLYMDADALYDWRLLDRLLGSAHADCVLIARGDPDPEWLEVRIRNDRIVAFDKGVTRPEYDIRAEWVGFARFRVATAARFAGAIERYVARGEVDLIYEKPMRDVILATGAFAFEDIPTTSHGVAPRARLRHRAQWAARAAARQAGLSDPASEQAIPRRRRHAHRPALGSAPRQSVAEASEGGVDHA